MRYVQYHQVRWSFTNPGLKLNMSQHFYQLLIKLLERSQFVAFVASTRTFEQVVPGSQAMEMTKIN